MIRIMARKNFSPLDKLERALPGRLDDSTRDVADTVVKYIKDNWSEISPSAKGSAPAVVSGDLNSTIKAVRRDGRGRFASRSDAVTYVVQAGDPNKKTEAHPKGIVYAAVLEDKYDRPFMEPAMRHAEAVLKISFERIFSVTDELY